MKYKLKGWFTGLHAETSVGTLHICRANNDVGQCAKFPLFVLADKSEKEPFQLKAFPQTYADHGNDSLWTKFADQTFPLPEDRKIAETLYLQGQVIYALGLYFPGEEKHK